MARPVQLARGSKFIVLASVCVVVGALYFAREVLVPLALAILLTFLLAPLVRRLERVGLSRVPATLVSSEPGEPPWLPPSPASDAPPPES